MGKKLSEMSSAELWELFPIFLTEHQDSWRQTFEEERLGLFPLLPDDAIISHIGSTAVNGIWAKPIIDILVELRSRDDLVRARESLEAHGYICMSAAETRISLNKGYTEKGFAEKVFHIHLRLVGDNDEIAFRDLMNSDQQLAKQYEKLKLELWKKYEHDRDGYTAAKTEFVAECMNRIKNSRYHMVTK